MLVPTSTRDRVPCADRAASPQAASAHQRSCKGSSTSLGQRRHCLFLCGDVSDVSEVYRRRNAVSRAAT